MESWKQRRDRTEMEVEGQDIKRARGSKLEGETEGMIMIKTGT